MGRSREAKVWMRIADHALERGEQVSLRHACLACVDAVSVAGAGLSIRGDDHGQLVCAIGDLSERLEELQVTLGEGPSVSVLASAGPVLSSDLASDSGQRRWSVFAPAAVEMGVGAMFSFPLQAGAIRLGVLTLYRMEPNPLSAEALGDALAFADAALVLMLDGAAGVITDMPTRQANGYGREGGMELHHIEVHQAVGKIAAQLDVAVGEALVRLRAYAYSNDQRLSDVARAVVAGRVRFETDQEGI